MVFYFHITNYVSTNNNLITLLPYVGTASLHLFWCSFILLSNSSKVFGTLHKEASSSQTCSRTT